MDIILFIQILACIVGACFGSFLNVLIYRLPNKMSIFYPPSACVKCKNQLKFYHNVPIFGWIMLGGKCAFCKEKISFIYPVIEFICALIFFFCFKNIEEINLYFLAKTCLLAIAFALLLALCIIDIKYLAVPHLLLVFTLLLFFVANFSLQTFNQILFFAGAAYLLKSILEAFINMKKDEKDCIQVMGEADIEIIAIMGILDKISYGFCAVFLAAIISLPVFFVVKLSGKNNIELPFIPFLSIAFALIYIFPNLAEWMLGFYGL
ncbi:prepilin peptidase [Campylobacter canadensis]|uniref:Prepilin peptidase n=1 Tax=Campylobacter canadensis TaxID=449520 RepID=A0ABS7WPP4_9BACT|nr:A24 family peptidase [Campylobacter canadensis]MBZ7986746.1 prepilin peptidase [Campylobacter canadensis]MBZ7994565.1 prepilin peptidase [Campylobacter canadensis]MBZ7997078.1 prepilin peptidase [Campylobacter canadensis]MBZ7997783.1 prepilin peptidase [Campylobacter canadensis]MBZ7999896.1 prepilin peptidase [Campylobacter canadensis]